MISGRLDVKDTSDGCRSYGKHAGYAEALSETWLGTEASINALSGSLFEKDLKCQGDAGDCSKGFFTYKQVRYLTANLSSSPHH